MSPLLCIIAMQAFVLFSPFEESVDNVGYRHVRDSDLLWTSNRSFPMWSSIVAWSYPPDGIYTMEGVYGGLTWAMHPDLCEQLIPTFADARYLFAYFIDCNSLRAAINEALTTWSSNHPLLQFHDKTDSCVPQSNGNCEGIQITIKMDNSAHNSIAAFVLHNFDDVVFKLWTTANENVDGIALKEAGLSLSDKFCWYMDSTFCIWFHRFPTVGPFSISDVLTTVMLCTFVLSISAVMIFVLRFVVIVYGHSSLYEFFKQVRACTLRPKRPRDVYKWQNARRLLANTSPCSVLLLLFWPLFVPVFYSTVYLPCTDCYGFSGMIAHEIGHVIGFHHPNELSNLNLVRKRRTSCRNPWGDVELMSVEDGYDSIMNSHIRHRSSTCLTQDDVNGLYTLYPLCDATDNDVRIPQPICNEPVRTQGVLRLLISLTIPFTVVAFVVIVVLNVTRCLQQRHVRRLQSNVQRRKHQARWLRAVGRANWAISTNRPSASRSPKNNRHFARRTIDRSSGVNMVQSLFGLTPRSGLTPRMPWRSSKRLSKLRKDSDQQHVFATSTAPRIPQTIHEDEQLDTHQETKPSNKPNHQKVPALPCSPNQSQTNSPNSSSQSSASVEAPPKLIERPNRTVQTPVLASPKLPTSEVSTSSSSTNHSTRPRSIPKNRAAQSGLQSPGRLRDRKFVTTPSFAQRNGLNCNQIAAQIAQRTGRRSAIGNATSHRGPNGTQRANCDGVPLERSPRTNPRVAASVNRTASRCSPKPKPKPADRLHPIQL